MYSSPTLERLVEILSQLPGIGKKSAQRIALHLLRADRTQTEGLARTILELREKVRRCSICFNLTEEDPCTLCQDPKRDGQIICVVEEPKDLLTIERAGGYQGRYHVLGGVLSPLDGIGEGNLRIQELLARIDQGVKEVILATNPTMEGEMTASHIATLLKSKGIKITRIARGVPFGGDLEFNDVVTVAKAIEGRVEL